MGPQRIRRMGRVLWRALLWAILLLLLIVLPLLVMLGSEGGSRWVLAQGLGMQKAVTVRSSSGNLLTGLELQDVHLRTSRLDLRIRHVLARWSLLQLLRGDINLTRLQAEGVALRMLTPSSGKPVHLPVLVLPVRLVIHHLDVHDASLLPWQAKKPLALQRLMLAGQWQGDKLQLQRLEADHKQIGRLHLQGYIRLRADYPLDLKGSLDYLPFRTKGWQPVAVHLQQALADMDVQLDSQGSFTATAKGHIKPLLSDLPYSATLQWQAVKLPWWAAQSWASRGGRVDVTGGKTGLQSHGNAQLSGRSLPAGHYTWEGLTNWKSANIESLNFNGLGGNLKVKGNVNWQNGVAWVLSSQATRLDLARHWTIPHSVVPVLTGRLESKGHATKKGSALTASVRLADGESWDIQEKGSSWVWNQEAPQDIKLQWAHVQRRLPGLEGVNSEAGSLGFKGARANYRLSLDADLQGPRLPAGHWVAEATGQDRHVDIQRIGYAGEAGELGFGGELELGSTLRWRGALVLSDFSTAWLNENWSGRFTGHMAGYGSWGKAGRELHLEDNLLTGTLREQAVLVDGPLDFVLPRQKGWPRFWTPGLSVKWGPNQALLKGGLRESEWALAAQLNVVDMAVLDPRLQGAVQGQLYMQGAERLPDIHADLQAEGAGTKGLRAATASMQMHLLRLGESASTVAFRADGLTTAAGRDLGLLQLDATGSQSTHQLTWQAGNEELHTQGSVGGTLDNKTLDWKGEMGTGQVSSPSLQWQLGAPFALGWVMADRQFHLAPHCWLSEAASLCNEQEMLLGPVGKVHVKLSGLQAERLGSFLPEGLAMTGLIEGRARGGWRAGEHPTLDADLHAEKGELRLRRDEPLVPLVLGYQRIGLAAVASGTALELHLDLASADMGQGHMDASIDPYAERKPLQGQLSLQGLRLEVFQPFFPALSALAGVVSADGRLAGDLQQPQFWGALQMTKGKVGLHQLPVNINDIDARIEVQGTRADISGNMKSGRGTATLSGQAEWAQQPHLSLALQGQRFELRQEPQILVEINPDLQLELVPGRVDITGNIRVPMARLDFKRLADKATPLSPDVTIITTEKGGRAQVAKAMNDWTINADISLLLGDDVYFHGYGVNGRLMGGLRLRQQGKGGLEANGEIELDENSRFDAYGQRLRIRRGRLIFAGNLKQPALDVEAVREIDDKIVGVRVEGRASAPVATLFSDSAMSQEEIISYLVLGRPLNASGKPESGQNLSAVAAAIKLGATGGAGLTDRLGGVFGISDLAVDAEGGGDDTQVTVSGYLNPKLYLRYGMGIFTPVNTVTVRYKINSKLYLEAVTSLESAIDLFYNWRF